VSELSRTPRCFWWKLWLLLMYCSNIICSDRFHYTFAISFCMFGFVTIIIIDSQLSCPPLYNYTSIYSHVTLHYLNVSNSISHQQIQRNNHFRIAPSSRSFSVISWIFSNISVYRSSITTLNNSMNFCLSIIWLLFQTICLYRSVNIYITVFFLLYLSFCQLSWSSTALNYMS
jgi:hypothetical protein